MNCLTSTKSGHCSFHRFAFGDFQTLFSPAPFGPFAFPWTCCAGMQMLAVRLVVLALILPASAKTGGSCALQTKAATKKGAGEAQKTVENQTEGGLMQLWS